MMNSPTFILKRGSHVANLQAMHTIMSKEGADLEGYSYLDTRFDNNKQINIEEWVPTEELETYQKLRKQNDDIAN